jgi:hypothetical protein
VGLELGLLWLINGGISSPPFSGGYYVALPKNAIPPNWTYRFIGETDITVLARPIVSPASAAGLKFVRYEIKTFGVAGGNGSDAIDLMNQIFPVLQGFRGLLPDGTQVDSIWHQDTMDQLEDPDARTFSRMMEFKVGYY